MYVLFRHSWGISRREVWCVLYPWGPEVLLRVTESGSSHSSLRRAGPTWVWKEEAKETHPRLLWGSEACPLCGGKEEMAASMQGEGVRQLWFLRGQPHHPVPLHPALPWCHTLKGGHSCAFLVPLSWQPQCWGEKSVHPVMMPSPCCPNPKAEWGGQVGEEMVTETL
jgi:hypothetical protein